MPTTPNEKEDLDFEHSRALQKVQKKESVCEYNQMTCSKGNNLLMSSLIHGSNNLSGFAFPQEDSFRTDHEFVKGGAAKSVTATKSILKENQRKYQANQSNIDQNERKGVTGNKSHGSKESASNPASNFLPSPQSLAKNEPEDADRFKTELCRSWEELGRCKYGLRCKFAHGCQELRALDRHPRYKTAPCRQFHSRGFCSYGSRCHFIHGETDRLLLAFLLTALQLEKAKLGHSKSSGKDGNAGPKKLQTNQRLVEKLLSFNLSANDQNGPTGNTTQSGSIVQMSPQLISSVTKQHSAGWLEANNSSQLNDFSSSGCHQLLMKEADNGMKQMLISLLANSQKVENGTNNTANENCEISLESFSKVLKDAMKTPAWNDDWHVPNINSDVNLMNRLEQESLTHALHLHENLPRSRTVSSSSGDECEYPAESLTATDPLWQLFLRHQILLQHQPPLMQQLQQSPQQRLQMTQPQLKKPLQPTKSPKIGKLSPGQQAFLLSKSGNDWVNSNNQFRCIYGNGNINEFYCLPSDWQGPFKSEMKRLSPTYVMNNSSRPWCRSTSLESIEFSSASSGSPANLRWPELPMCGSFDQRHKLLLAPQS